MGTIKNITENRLTPKQENFVNQYIIHFNGTLAVKEAGYKHRNADKIASQLLGKTRVSQAIRDKIEARAKRTQITQDKVVNELAKVAFANIGDIISENGTIKSPSEWSDDAKGFIASVDVVELFNAEGQPVGYLKKIRFHDKLKALEKLYQHTSTDRFHVNVEISNPDTIKLELAAQLKSELI